MVISKTISSNGNFLNVFKTFLNPGLKLKYEGLFPGIVEPVYPEVVAVIDRTTGEEISLLRFTLDSGALNSLKVIFDFTSESCQNLLEKSFVNETFSVSGIKSSRDYLIKVQNGKGYFPKLGGENLTWRFIVLSDYVKVAYPGSVVSLKDYFDYEFQNVKENRYYLFYNVLTDTFYIIPRNEIRFSKTLGSNSEIQKFLTTREWKYMTIPVGFFEIKDFTTLTQDFTEFKNELLNVGIVVDLNLDSTNFFEEQKFFVFNELFYSPQGFELEIPSFDFQVKVDLPNSECYGKNPYVEGFLSDYTQEESLIEVFFQFGYLPDTYDFTPNVDFTELVDYFGDSVRVILPEKFSEKLLNCGKNRLKVRVKFKV